MTEKSKKEEPYEKSAGLEYRWFFYMKKGKKKVEARLNDPNKKFSKWKKGDIIIWKSVDPETKENVELKTKIKRVSLYKDFTEYFIHEGLRNTLPSIKTLEEGLAVYHEYYAKEDKEDPKKDRFADIKKFGVCAFEITLI